MAVTYVGAASAASNSVSLPSFTPGDVAICAAIRSDASSPYPTIPSGWTLLAGGANATGGFCAITAYRVLQSGDTTTGTWTNATGIGVVVYSGVHQEAPIDGRDSGNGDNSSSINTGTSTVGVAGTTQGVMLAITTSASAAANVDELATTNSTNKTSGLSLDHFGVAQYNSLGPVTTISESFTPGVAIDWVAWWVGLRAASTFPVVDHDATTAGQVAANSTAWSATYPLNLVAGDLILVVVGADGNGVRCSHTDFSQGPFRTDATASISVMAKVSDGTETGAFTITMSASEQGCWRAFRIVGWEGTLAGGLSAHPSGSWSNGVETPPWSNGSGTAPDPGSLNPNAWDLADTLWLAVAASDHGNTTYTGWPTDFVATSAQESGGSTGAALATAWRELNAASVDPSAFTTDAAEGWAAGTIAIRPPAAGPVALAGSSAGGSTAGPTLLRKSFGIAGSSAGGSTAAANLTNTRPLAGSSAGTSTAAGVLGLSKFLIGSAAGTSTAAGVLRGAVPLAGSSAGVATAAATLRGAVPLAGSSAASSTATAALTKTVYLTGSSAGVGAAVSALTIIKQSARYADTAATAAAAPENANDWVSPANAAGGTAEPDGLEATIVDPTFDSPDISYRLLLTAFGFAVPGTATILGIVIELNRRKMAGNAADYRVQLLVSGTPSGDNKASGTAWPATAGTASYGSSADGWGISPTPAIVNATDFGVVVAVSATSVNTDIAIDWARATIYYIESGAVALAGSSAGVATAVGFARVAVKLLASSAGIGTAAARLSGSVPLLGSSAGIGTAAALLTNTRPLAGSSAGVATAAGVLSTGGQAVALAGSSAGIATGTARLSGSVPLAGASAGVTTAAATLRGAVPLMATSAGVSTATGLLVTQGEVALSGTSAGAATAAAALRLTVGLAGATPGTATAAAYLRAARALLGSAAGTGTASANLSRALALAAAAAGSSSAAGSLSVLGESELLGSSAGVSTALARLSVQVNLHGAAAGTSSAEATMQQRGYFWTGRGERITFRAPR